MTRLTDYKVKQRNFIQAKPKKFTYYKLREITQRQAAVTTQENHFHYQKSAKLENLTLLKAQMSDFSYGNHAHEEYSFGVTLTGSQDFFSAGEFFRSKPGNTMVFNPGQVHDGHSGASDSLRYRMLYIHPDQFEPMLKSAGVRHSRDFQIADTLHNDEVMRGTILKLVTSVEQGNSDAMQQECELYQLAARVAQLYGQYEPDEKVSRVDALLRRAQQYINANLHNDLSLDQIAAEANLSKYHFLRMFRQQFGLSPHQYILNQRINRAREALIAGRRLEDVVFDFGFTDLSHFNRRFKPIFGMTPKQFQRQFLTD